jgi:hypothetical protein
MPLVVGMLSEPALAKKKKRQNNQSGAQDCVDPGQCRGYGDFLNDLKGQHPDDQYLDGGEYNDGGRQYYWFRMLDPSGRVRDVGVDPDTGQWFNLQ